MSISSTDLSLHQARMLYINGDVDGAVNIYKEVINGLFVYAEQDPQHASYYTQYGNMLLEEAKAMREQQRKQQQKSAQRPVSYAHPEEPSQPQQLYPQETYNQPGTSGNPPVAPPLPPKVQNSHSAQLTASDIRYAALGVGQKIKQFDQDYGVSEKCKTAANACMNKARELDEEYEIRQKAINMGHQIKEWDERNGVSKAIMNGIHQATTSVTNAIKGYADQTRKESQNPY